VEKLEQSSLVNKEMVLNFYTRFIYHPEEWKSSHFQRIKFSSQFFGCNTTFPGSSFEKGGATPAGVMMVKEPSLFKRKLPLLPVISSEPF
jgi:hypothetical protein